ncbi:hypothetical protein F5B20DRAFT_96092 [Whalleya microplaca]|nr:hypothetical protein F5B20DRAFT_96092 [Whalleya microplaca]
MTKQEASANDECATYGERPGMTGEAFACPFYRQNPAGNLACLRQLNLRSVQDLIQHLWDVHRQPPHCPICYATFSTTEVCDTHIRSKLCTLQETPRSQGLTIEQMEEIFEEPPTPIARAVEWFRIWGIAFPGEEPPLRPYVSGGIESVLCEVREFWSGHGQSIILGFLKEEGLHSGSGIDEGLKLEALQDDILHRMINRIITCNRHDNSEEMQGPKHTQAAKFIASLGQPPRICLKDEDKRFCP